MRPVTPANSKEKLLMLRLCLYRHGPLPQAGGTLPASWRGRSNPGGLIVGAFLMWLDIRPFDVFRGLKQLIDRVWSLGFDAIREIANYILAGAALVVPIWLVLRLMNMRNGH